MFVSVALWLWHLRFSQFKHAKHIPWLIVNKVSFSESFGVNWDVFDERSGVVTRRWKCMMRR